MLKKDDIIMVLFVIGIIAYGYFTVYIFDQLFVMEANIKTQIFEHYGVKPNGDK